jgi:hypothetical protein
MHSATCHPYLVRAASMRQCQPQAPTMSCWLMGPARSRSSLSFSHCLLRLWPTRSMARISASSASLKAVLCGQGSATTASNNRTSAPHVKHRTRSTWCPMQREGQQKACVDVFSARTHQPGPHSRLHCSLSACRPSLMARGKEGGGDTRVSNGCNRRRDMELPQDNAVC